MACAAWSRGYIKVVCFSDSLLAVSLIDKGTNPSHRYATTVADIRRWKSESWQLSFHHVIREGNQCADFLAKLGVRSGRAMRVLDEPPSSLVKFLKAYEIGSVFFVCRLSL
ncbi:Ribonuclease H-like superfamily [Sesbania bispinosa]|nr:Ribonuclease H-like superfamily [Sesbania bispinosa]